MIDNLMVLLQIPFFCRRGEDLVMCMDIQLVEALCGFQKPIAMLDNRTIIITSHPGKFTALEKTVGAYKYFDA